MSTRTYTKDDLKKERDDLQDRIAELEKQKTKDLDSGKITVARFRQINGEQLVMENQLNLWNVQLATKQFDSITVEKDSPAAKLKSSIKNLKAAIDQLDDLRKFLDSVSDVINAVNSVISVITKLP
jgi:chromosome segregation ATPase